MSPARPERRQEGNGLGLLELIVLGTFTVVLSVIALSAVGWDLLPLAFVLLLVALALVLLVVRRLEREPDGQDDEDGGSQSGATSSAGHGP